MPNSIANLSRPGVYSKLRTVTSWVEQCVCEWVTPGRSYRELSTQERLSRIASNLERNGEVTDNRPKSRRDTYLPPINVAGEREVMPKSEIWTPRAKYDCLRAARDLCANS